MSANPKPSLLDELFHLLEAQTSLREFHALPTVFVWIKLVRTTWPVQQSQHCALGLCLCWKLKYMQLILLFLNEQNGGFV